jgi:hypothetical protein
MMLESASVVGFIIGFFVPTFYRRIPQRRQERQRLSVDLNEDQDGDPVVPVVPVEHNDRRAAA